MKFQSMPVKRRSVKKGAFRKLYANVTKKKKRQRASTAAMPAGDIEGDVPNLGVARALVVILVIHVVAIAGIFFHSHWLDDDSDKSVSVGDAAAAPAPSASAREDGNMPKIRSGDSIYTVGAGDTYENIAKRKGVSENELRLANDNIEIRAGRYLRIPPKKIVAVEPSVITETRANSRQPADSPIHDAPAAPPLVATEAAIRADAGPAVSRGNGSASHVVRSGDTFWSIARKYGTSVDALMKANRISNPKHLRLGMSLTIPQ